MRVARPRARRAPGEQCDAPGIARTREVEHLLGQLVHPQQLVDREVGELARLGVVLDAPANELEAVPKRRDRVTNLVRELRHESPRRRRDGRAA